MAKKKEDINSLSKGALQEELKKKDSALERLRRELDIEAALEKVRSRTMAMRRSEELADAALLLFQQITDLGVHAWTSGFQLWDEDRKAVTVWTSTKGDLFPPFKIPTTEDPLMIHITAAAQQEEILYVEEAGGKALEDHYSYMSSLPTLKELFSKVAAGGHAIPTFQINHAAFFKFGYLLFITHESCLEAHGIFIRFAKVFEQTYTRFLDLQKAEAQTREAQIETALEKVRSRTMSMHRSDELSSVATILFQQVKAFGVQQWSCGFSIWEIGDKEFTWYAGDPDGAILPPFKIPLTEHPVFIRFDESRRKGEEFFFYEKEGEMQASHYRYMLSLPGLGEHFQSLLDTGITFPEFQIDHVANFSHGNLVFITYEHFPEMHDIFKRFAKVFEQTYTRFLDLQRAEAQARESQIEAALERVRSRSMGMQKSEELREVIQVIYEQLVQLNFRISNAGFLMDYRDSDDYNIWMTDATTEFPTKIHIPYFDHPFNNDYLEHRDKGPALFTRIYAFEEKNAWFQSVWKDLSVTEEIKKAILAFPALVVSRVFLKNIGIYLLNFDGTPYSEDENATFIRFGKVFEQTYIRFNDLKQAEAQALEAIKRASVDRIRAEIASMRTTSDLERITPLIWNELISLGVPITRCGVFIFDEEHEQVHTFLSTPEGKAILSFTSTFSNQKVITEALPYWRRKEIYKTHWDETAFLDQANTLVHMGAISSSDAYLTGNLPKNLYLHFLPFLQGILYVGNTDSLSNAHLQLVQALADAFSTAYARYEDFNKLESANLKIEKTLVDLKQTQAQLVQSEKMASLGELTAGIAHEIQTPLNFVNNFSEVNRELLAELNDEIEKGNYDEARLIAKDVANNEEKISHHGKRADAIVKGMLQHSRSSSATKEPTDINKLADEYLRLAYHGIRAKDNSFNVSLKTDYHQGNETISVFPQDIGRVLLNLYNNAFYAVTEKKKQEGDAYQPLVLVSTKKMDGKFEIIVNDNGNGIPQKVQDKIFQPFFTTKPTGQGTGLGLSLSYDIIKAHGGEIKVQTKQGKGSAFIIELPIK